jgi:hypothetical protein
MSESNSAQQLASQNDGTSNNKKQKKKKKKANPRNSLTMERLIHHPSRYGQRLFQKVFDKTKTVRPTKSKNLLQAPRPAKDAKILPIRCPEIADANPPRRRPSVYMLTERKLETGPDLLPHELEVVARTTKALTAAAVNMLFGGAENKEEDKQQKQLSIVVDVHHCTPEDHDETDSTAALLGL